MWTGKNTYLYVEIEQTRETWPARSFVGEMFVFMFAYVHVHAGALRGKPCVH